MVKAQKLPVDVHPVADIFPMMSDDEFEGLKADIAEHGLREPLVFWKNQLIDGRNRLKACLEIGFDYDGHCAELDDDEDPVAFVVSHNLHRRSLTQSQRAMVGNKLRAVFDEAAKERQAATQIKNGKSPVVENLPGPERRARDEAGKAVGVSGKLIDAARTVQERGSKDLIAKVEAGEVAVTKAAKIAKTVEKKEQVKALESLDEKPRIHERNVFSRLRSVFDSMTRDEQERAAVMWDGWLDDKE